MMSGLASRVPDREITQAELAEFIGMSRPWVSIVENKLIEGTARLCDVEKYLGGLGYRLVVEKL